MADVNKGMLFSLDGGLSPKRQVAVGSGLTDISYGKDGAFATVIGFFTDAGLGTIVEFVKGRPRIVGTGLRRPTSLIALDLDDDPEEELIVTEFGSGPGTQSLGLAARRPVRPHRSIVPDRRDAGARATG